MNTIVVESIKHLKFIFTCFLFLLLSSSYAAATQDAIIDLSSYNFQEGKLVELDCKWAFYWEELHGPSQMAEKPTPDFYTEMGKIWGEIPELEFPFSQFGYATYSAKVIIDKRKAPLLAFTLPAVYSSYRMWVNGELFTENGVVAKSKENYEAHWLPQSKIYEAKSDTLEIIFQIANFDHFKGGIARNILLGSSDAVFSYRERLIIKDFITIGLLIMAATIFFALYFMGTREVETLYFAVFCFVFSYRILDTDPLYYLHELIPSINWTISIHIEYITLFLSFYLFVRFINSLYPKDTEGIAERSVSAFSLSFVFLVIVGPIWLFTWASQYFLLLILLSVLYVFYIYAKGVKNKKPGYILGFISIFILGVAVWLNILSFLNVIEGSQLYFFFGFIGFLIFQSLILIHRFADKMNKAKLQAEEGEQSKSDFLATMSHEFRTPLNGVLGMSTLLEQTALTREQKDYVSTIKTSGENLLDVINDILDFSKSESGKLSLEKVECNIFELLDDVFAITSSLANSKKLELHYIIEKNVPEQIWIDSGKLKQVLVNLVNNALKFTEKGSVNVFVSVNSFKGKDFDLKFEVKDTGIGIPESKRSRLFKAFSQVDSSINRRYGGTGLGLAICKQIVNLMEGEIDVESTASVGSNFYFNIKTQKIASKNYADQFNFKEKRIALLLNSDTKPSRIVDFYKNSFGLNVSVSNNLRAFNKQVQEAFYDILIVDEDLLEGSAQIENIINEKANNQSLLLLLRPNSAYKNLGKKDLVRQINKPLRNTVLMETLRELFFLTDVRNADFDIPKKKQQDVFIPDYIKEKKPAILLVEDNDINQRIIKKLIEEAGLSIDAVGDGIEAIEAVENKAYGLILMDIQMPKMNGIEATKEIRKLNLETQPPIIALTANVSSEDKEECLEAGMNDYLSKPVDRNSLLKVIIQAFS